MSKAEGFHVFVGLTISATDARGVRRAHFFPPAREGDVLRAVERGARGIAIVDGMFRSSRPVAHKEIVAALAQGLPVYGGGGMGAVLAAELAAVGMIGVGRAFQRLASGDLADNGDHLVDDRRPPGDPRRAESLVDLQAALDGAVREGLIAEMTGRQAHRMLRQFPPAGRRHDALLAGLSSTGVAPSEVARLRRFLAAAKRVTRDDAEQLLLQLDPPGARMSPPSIAVERTAELEQLWRNVAVAEAARQPQAPPAHRSLPSGHSLTLLRSKALMRVLARIEASRTGVKASAAEVQAAVDRFRRQAHLERADVMSHWLRAQRLTTTNLAEAMHEFVLLDKLDILYRDEVERRLPDQVRMGSARLRTFLESPR